MTLLESITRWLTDADKAHNIIHGDASTTVTTDGGPVRSLAKLVADSQAAIDAQAPSLAQLAASGGAALVGGAALRLSDVSTLVAVSGSSKATDRTYSLAAYQPGWAALATPPVGGGEFEWVATYPKNRHNGGTVIDPDRPFPASWADDAQVEAWFLPAASGNGAFVRRFDGNVDTTMFGAMGGAIDATRSFEAAVSAVGANQTLSISGSLPQRITRTIEITVPGVDVVSDMTPIAFEGPEFAPVFRVKGTAGATMPVTAAIAQGATTFQLSAPDAATLAAGDWVKLYSTENYFVQTGRDYKKGELVKVKQVSGTTVTIFGQGVYLDYSASFTITAQKINMLKAGTFRGVNLSGGGAANRRVLVDALYAEGFRFINGELSDAEVGVRFTTCVRGKVLDSYLHGLNLTGTGYGVSVEGSSKYIEMTGCECEDNRHSFTTGGYDGVCMFLNVHHNKAYNHMVGAAFNTHGNARFATFESNEIDGAEIGISIYSPCNEVNRNIIKNVLKSAIYGTEAGSVNLNANDNCIGRTSIDFFGSIEVVTTATTTELNKYCNACRNTVDDAANGPAISLQTPALMVRADGNTVYRFGYQVVKIIGGDHISVCDNVAFLAVRGTELSMQIECTNPPSTPSVPYGTTVKYSGNDIARGADKVSISNATKLVLGDDNITNAGGTPKYLLTNVTNVYGGILRSPDGTLYRAAVGNGGVFATSIAATT